MSNICSTTSSSQMQKEIPNSSHIQKLPTNLLIYVITPFLTLPERSKLSATCRSIKMQYELPQAFNTRTVKSVAQLIPSRNSYIPLTSHCRSLTVHKSASSAAALRMLHLPSMTKLSKLEIPCSQITDNIFKALANLKGLKELKLVLKIDGITTSYNRSTDEGLKALSNLPKLEKLEVPETSAITKEGIAFLKSQLPDLQISLIR